MRCRSLVASFVFAFVLLFGLGIVFGVLRHPDMTDQQARDLAGLPQFDSEASTIDTGCSVSILNSEWAVLAAHCTGDPQVDNKRVTVACYVGGVQHLAPGTAYLVRSGDPGYDDVALIE